MSFVACAPELSRPNRFEGDLGVACPDVQREILWPRCALSGCHTTDDPTGGLELLTADIEHRLVDVESTTCIDEKLIDPEAPETSFLLTRLSPDPECNGAPVDRMPLVGPPLTDEELDCVRAWIVGLAADYRSASEVTP